MSRRANNAPRVMLLGPQRLKPTLALGLELLGVKGRIATITAGWQERERDDRELEEHLGGRCINLELHRRSELVYDADAELAAAHHARQAVLRELQQLYQLRLAYAMDACLMLLRRPGEGRILGPERLAAVEAVRTLDAAHLARVREVDSEFEARWRPAERAAVTAQRGELARIMETCEAVAVAGGHVAVLLNRLRLFGIAEFCAGRAVCAWSAGAMALSERVVLFYDDPPHGPGHPEVLESGLGLCSGVVALPHARRRLKLDDHARVALFSRRFAPAVSLALEDGALYPTPGAISRAAPQGVLILSEDGDLVAAEAA